MSASVVETHLSIVFFVGDHAYKLKKPVRFPFADLTTREAREAICHHEVALNRRLSPDVYEGVADIFAPDGSPYDHLVVMRRLPDDRRLAHLVSTGDSRAPGAIDDIAGLLAWFHDGAGRSPAIDAAGRRDAVSARWRRNAEQLRAMVGRPFDADELARADLLAERFLAGRAALFEDRIARGRICDGHGDLLADDVFVLDDGPRILDCIEFDDELRHVDVADDLAVLMMDLDRLGAPDLAERLLQVYELRSSDVPPANLVQFYVAYRAQVRALVAGLRAAQSDDDDTERAAHEEQADRLLHLCVEHVERATVRVVLIGGLPATGKSTIAAELGRRTGWPVLHSDLVRKELSGRLADESAAAPYGQGIYSPETTDATYGLLVERAREHLELGTSVVFDASFTSNRQRDRVRALAAETSASIVELRVTSDPAEAGRRLRARQPGAATGSDANVDIARQIAAVTDPWPESTEIPNESSIHEAVSTAVAATCAATATP